MTDNQLIHFAEYSKAYFMDSAKKKLLSQIKITPNAEAAALYFAKLNEAYFTGRNDQLPERSDLIDLPEIKNTFLSPYMESIYMEVPKNHNVFEIKVSE